MFGIGRELKRLFGGDRLHRPHDGLTGGDASLLELLDLNLLLDEARAADVAAGRVGARDAAARRLQTAAVWREAARRTGDPVRLRKAAAAAETAAAAFESARRMDAWAKARCEQAWCGLMGAELFGDQGLNAAAEVAFREARAAVRGGLTGALADLGLVTVAARQELSTGDAETARAVAARFDAPIAALDMLARRTTVARIWAADARLIRADLLCGFGARLQDEALLKLAVEDAAAAGRRVSETYEPLTSARAEILRAQALNLWGEATGDLEVVNAAAAVATAAIEQASRDLSPMDWARAQLSLAQVLETLGEAAVEVKSLEQAVTAYDRAYQVLKDAPATALRGLCAGARAVCLARTAELSGDLAGLDAAEAAMKIELTHLRPSRDPVTWALAQLHLARLYEARLNITGKDGGRRAAAVLAIDSALDVFAEHGQHALSALAYEALDRISADAPHTV